ncbi:MAG: hypothetical protein EBU90_06990 [Proteobacteria bacterium]|nr:hypothetical protein [Pseudomonadota bacterium]NBP14159.1 hypothetical protein [bacterium]
MAVNNYLIHYFKGSGFCNILMELETALASSYITGRTLIIPNVTHQCGVTHAKSTPKGSIWEVLDLAAIEKNFNVEIVDRDFITLDQYKNYYNINDSELNTEFLAENISNVYSVCFYNQKNITNLIDFQNFHSNRNIHNLNKQEKFLAVSHGGHFFYNVYPGTAPFRNELKNKINSAIKFKKQYLDLADAIQKKYLKDYDAIHVRHATFFNPYKNPSIIILDIINYPHKFKEQIDKLYEKDRCIYMATDLHKAGLLYDPPKKFDITSYKKLVRQDHNLVMLDDLNYQLSPTEEIAMELLLCTGSKKFYGTFYSTFSKRINIFRGIGGKQVTDYMGWNLIQDAWMEPTTVLPWAKLKHGWEWYYSSYPQWTYEDDYLPS